MVLVAVAPVILALVALMDDTVVWPMLAIDAGLVVLAAFDALLGRRALVAVERELPEVFSLGRQNQVTLELRSLARRKLSVEVVDDSFAEAEVFDLPARAQLPARG